MKIVINQCYGGFGLSKRAMLRYAELKGLTLYPESHDHGLFLTYWTVPPDKRPADLSSREFAKLPLENKMAYNADTKAAQIHDRDIERDDPTLVQVVEELGKAASGQFASLSVIEIPDGVAWEIEEYDGYESIHEKHRSWS